MKKILLSFLALILFTSSWAQSTTAILFTENGEKFTVILNGVRQHDKSETNVKITGLNSEFYKLKVIFDNKSLGDKNFNLAVELGSETSYCIKKNNKGEYVLRFVSTVPLAQAPVTTPSQTVVVYRANPAANSSSQNTNETITQQTTTTTTTTIKQGEISPTNSNKLEIKTESEGNVNKNVSGSNESSSQNANEVVQSQTTITTTSTTIDEPNTTITPDPVPPPVYLPGYNGPFGCSTPMSPGDFETLKSSITSKSFEDAKMIIAKQVVGQQCIYVSQLKEIMLLFSFEESKLEVAKFAHRHTYDVGNYFKVNDIFTFESSIEELNEYIKAE